MFKSIRWKLFAWYALILIVLASLFGGLLYVNARRTIEREVDGRLREQASALAAVLSPEREGKFLVELTLQQVEHFNQEGDLTPYYRIWNHARRIVDTSHPDLRFSCPAVAGSRDREGYREVSVPGPAGTLVLVGRNMRLERQQLRELAATASAVGTMVLLLMLGGGWFLTNRALAPIDRISTAAAAVSASNLSQRIDVGRMETELAQLAETINNAFDRLQQAFDRQTRFTADASHELRTPLSIIMSQTDLALKRQRSGEEYREALQTIRRAAYRMKAVVEGLLTLARADSGQSLLARASVDLRDVVAESCRMLAPLAADKRLTLTTQLEPARVVGDRDRLGEAVSNLVSNAIVYNRPLGRVDVALRTDREHATLVVADDGPGIPQADQPHVFDRFFRVDRARLQSGGSGLGLAITKWIADAHGATLRFTSGEGKGTTFVLQLPLEHEQPAHQPKQPFPLVAASPDSDEGAHDSNRSPQPASKPAP